MATVNDTSKYQPTHTQWISPHWIVLPHPYWLASQSWVLVHQDSCGARIAVLVSWGPSGCHCGSQCFLGERGLHLLPLHKWSSPTKQESLCKGEKPIMKALDLVEPSATLSTYLPPPGMPPAYPLVPPSALHRSVIHANHQATENWCLLAYWSDSREHGTFATPNHHRITAMSPQDWTLNGLTRNLLGNLIDLVYQLITPLTYFCSVKLDTRHV